MSGLSPRVCLALITPLALAIGWQSPASAADNDVVLVEEHWELQVGGPDADRSAPQVSMVMSPNGSLDEDFFVVTLNHGSFPDFAAGGVQLQRWCGEECVSAKNSVAVNSLVNDGETVTWVQRMSLDGGALKMEVVDGSSTSWGSFGSTGQLQDVITTGLTRLNQYVPATSLTESGIGYAGNRVSSLTLQKLVWKTADGVVHELNAPIDISTGLDP